MKFKVNHIAPVSALLVSVLSCNNPETNLSIQDTNPPTPSEVENALPLSNNVGEGYYFEPMSSPYACPPSAYNANMIIDPYQVPETPVEYDPNMVYYF